MGGRVFRDLDIRFEKAGRGYKAIVVDSPAGTVEARFRTPIRDYELENFALKMQRGHGDARRIDSPQTARAKELGQALFDALFHDELLACLRDSIREAAREERGLRIRLRLKETPTLANLPWEYLYDRHLNRFLSLSDTTPVVRYLELPEPVRPLEVTGPLRILAMVSAPTDYPTLDVEAEWAKLNDALENLEKDGRVEIEELTAASLTDLRRALRRNGHNIFHFIGHGGYDDTRQEGVLVFADEDNNGLWVSGERLGIDLHDASALRMVVLNACEGARGAAQDPFSGVAQSLIQQGLPAVVAMQFEIADQPAIRFAHEFYSALADGLPVDAAMSEARKAIHDVSALEWATPVLYLRAPDGRIFDLAQAPRPAARHEGEQEEPAREADLERHVATEAPVKETPPPPSDHTVQRLWGEGLAAYLTHQWAEAVEAFEALVSLQPEYRDAAAKLDEAQTELRLIQLYDEGRTAEEAGDWGVAIDAYSAAIDTRDGFRDATNRLEHCRRQQELAPLLHDLRDLAAGEHWEAVVRLGEQLAETDPAVKDPDGLVTTARQRLEQAAAAEAEARLARQYEKARAAEDAGDLDRAIEIYTTVVASRDDYQDASDRVVRCLQKQQVIRDVLRLQDDLRRRARNGWWMDVVRIGEQIGTLDPDAADPEGLVTSARAHLADAGTPQKRAIETSEDRTSGYVPKPQTLQVGQWVLCLAISSDGTRLATGSRNRVRMWDLRSGREIWNAQLGALSALANINGVAFSPDGTKLATGSDDNKARVWNARSGKELLKVRHASPVFGVAFSRDGTRLATASADKEARVWNAKSGEELLTLRHAKKVNGVAFSPDGTKVATASADHTACLWDVTDGSKLLTVKHDLEVHSVTFNLDGTRFATASDDGTARVWDAANGKTLLKVRHSSWVRGAVFSPDGTRLITGSDDNTARIWDMCKVGRR